MSSEKGTDSSGAPEPRTWRFGSAELDEASLQLRVRGAEIRATPQALLVLRCLLRSCGRLVTKSDLVSAVWGEQDAGCVSDREIGRCIRELRRALTAENRACIVAVREQGWRLDVDGGPCVRCHAMAAPPQAITPLRPGDPVPGRNGYVLGRLLEHSQGIQTWEASSSPDSSPRICKIAVSELGRASLRQTLRQQLYLQEALGADAGILRVHDWQLHKPPGLIELTHSGGNLASRMTGDGLRAMPLAERVGLLLDIAATVAAAHDVGVLHRDLRPRNIWISPVWQGGKARVDFCIPDPCDADLPVAPGSTGAGTHHLAPELRSGHAPTQRSEVYALGVLLCQLAAGRTPGPGWSRDVDSDLGLVILAATEADPARRTASVAALIRRLRELPPSRARDAAGEPRRAAEDAGAASQPYGRVLPFRH